VSAAVSDASVPHLSIGEVLALLQPEFPDVTISKIRFLESQGLLDPERTPSGYRKFYEDDLTRLRWILTQQRDHFLPLKVIKERLAEETHGAPPGDVAAPTQTATPMADEPVVLPPPIVPAPGDRAALAEALARRAAQRIDVPAPYPPQPAAPMTSTPAPPTLDAGPSDISLTAAELASAAGIPEREVDRLASFGLLDGHTVGRDVFFDGDALIVARLAAAFLVHGIEPRHLRMFKVAVEREAGVYEQLVTPLARQRSPEARAQAEQKLGELAGLGSQLRAALLRGAVRDLTQR
jgi:DNA-binding transcriptional MerR regulator